MLQIYLPIAEVTINVATLLFVSVVVGFFAGLLGIGGGSGAMTTWTRQQTSIRSIFHRQAIQPILAQGV